MTIDFSRSGQPSNNADEAEQYAADRTMRMHANVQRMVGGVSGLVREICRINSSLEQITTAPLANDLEAKAQAKSVASDGARVFKRALFMAYELEHRLSATDPSAAEAPTMIGAANSPRAKLAELNRYFFVELGFTVGNLPERSQHSLAPLNLERVMIERTGAAATVALLYGFLAERIGISLEFVKIAPQIYLRFNDLEQDATTEDATEDTVEDSAEDAIAPPIRRRASQTFNQNKSFGVARFIDLSRGGKVLGSHELIEIVQSKFAANDARHDLLGSHSFESFVVQYLEQAKSQLCFHHEAEKLLFLQNNLIAYQPSAIQLLAERALISRRLGLRREALRDLKRYFTFFDKASAPSELVTLFDELNSRVQTKK